MDSKTNDQIDELTTYLDEATTIVEELTDDSPASLKKKDIKDLKTSVRDAKAAADKLEDQQEKDSDKGEDDDDDNEGEGEGEDGD